MWLTCLAAALGGDLRVRLQGGTHSSPFLPPCSRQQEIEEKLIEEETARRVEELVAKRVEEELEKRKDEIEREVLRRVEEAKRIMERQLLEELERQRQAEVAAQKAREVTLRRLERPPFRPNRPKRSPDSGPGLSRARCGRGTSPSRALGPAPRRVLAGARATAGVAAGSGFDLRVHGASGDFVAGSTLALIFSSGPT